MLLSKDHPKSTGRNLRPVFVAGCQCSGTTLMGQVIGVHRLAVLVDETDDPCTRLHVISDASNDTVGNGHFNDLCRRAQYENGSLHRWARLDTLAEALS